MYIIMKIKEVRRNILNIGMLGDCVLLYVFLKNFIKFDLIRMEIL